MNDALTFGLRLCNGQNTLVSTLAGCGVLGKTVARFRFENYADVLVLGRRSPELIRRWISEEAGTFSIVRFRAISPSEVAPFFGS
jgi:hypothetical protein